MLNSGYMKTMGGYWWTRRCLKKKVLQLFGYSCVELRGHMSWYVEWLSVHVAKAYTCAERRGRTGGQRGVLFLLRENQQRKVVAALYHALLLQYPCVGYIYTYTHVRCMGWEWGILVRYAVCSERKKQQDSHSSSAVSAGSLFFMGWTDGRSVVNTFDLVLLVSSVKLGFVELVELTCLEIQQQAEWKISSYLFNSE